MTPTNRNTLWARVFVDELVRAGLQEVCVAPGSRSTPLVLAISDRPELRAFVHLDERSAAFFALGVGRGTGRPCAVVTTSGTAAANLLPAVVEADQGEVPLLVLTADRPPHLRGTDSNQTIDQLRLYGPRTRLFADVSPPEMVELPLRALRALADRAVAACTGSPAGPVHLNFPFAKPLEPKPSTGDVPTDWEEGAPLGPAGRTGARPLTRVWQPAGELSGRELRAVVGRLQEARRPLLVAGPGPRPGRTGESLRSLAATLSVPLLADPLSGARFGPGAEEHAVAAYDLFLRPGARPAGLEPDLVLRFGASPTSQALTDFLAGAEGAEVVVLAAGGRWKDHLAGATEYLLCDPGTAAGQIAGRAGDRRETEWTRRWREIGRASLEALRPVLHGEFFEGTVAAEVVGSVAEGGTLFVGNSMPIRDVDAFAAPRASTLRVLGNRGASGIDGLVSTALGVASGTEGPVTALLGDLSLYHDMNGLFAARRHGIDVTFVIVNNDGGGIFHMLPVRAYEPAFTEFFATPHGLDFSHAARLYGLPYARVDDRSGLRHALREESEGSRLIEVASDRERNRECHREAVAAVTEATRSLAG